MIMLIIFYPVVLTKCNSEFHKILIMLLALLFIWLSAFEVVLHLSGVRAYCKNNEEQVRKEH